LAADSINGGADLPPFRVLNGKTIYTLSGDAFASGNATLTAMANASLQALAGKLAKTKAISVVGYTDSQGDAKTNLALSKQRADVVRRALVTAGLKPDRIKAIGRGEEAPLLDNHTEQGRARNRRVEVVVD